jgi:Glycosyltransferase like family 2
MPSSDESADSMLFHHTWTRQRRAEPPATALNSPLLALHASSDVDRLLPEQIRDARQVLLAREAAGGAAPHDLQRQVVRRFLAGRAAHFGAQQCAPFDEAAELAREGRDVFLIVKFMDEAPHLEATLRSLLHQDGVDPGRVVIVAVDNNSADGSDRIVKQMAASCSTRARIIYVNQAVPGAGNGARLGVDRCIATVLRMCELDGNWSRLQDALIAVSDGDTVYHPHLLRETVRIFESCPTVDAVMPFLSYKLTAALRLFDGYRPARPDLLRRFAALDRATATRVSLAGETAFECLPRWRRRRRGDDLMELGLADGGVLTVALCNRDGDGRRFGVLRDPAGRLAYVLADRTLVLAEAPVSGSDAALVYLENGGVRAGQKWRWHGLIGHDLFLHWLFAGLGVPEEVVYPDTSDALKTIRAWAFAIGGQHQLRRPGLRIVTGSDYQSGRVLQAVGAVVRLGPAEAMAQTEIDRLIKMVRNLVGDQAVFYGNIRSTALERASGLYVHMTRIQGDIEEEVRGYDDEAFATTVFPERILFLLRWLLQNAMRFYAHEEDEARRIVADRVLAPMFGENAAGVERDWFAAGRLDALREAGADERLDVAERLAERFIAENYPALMRLYARTLRDFFDRQHVAAQHYEWLFDGLETSPNAIVVGPRDVDPAAVWDGDEFVIDVARGQVLSMRAKTSRA